jgi:large subunit ribosomal protein L4
MPKKMRLSAMRGGLSSRHEEGAISALDTLSMDEPRTRVMVDSLAKLGLTSGSVLFVDQELVSNAALSARNIEGVEMVHAASLNLLHVLKADRIVFTKAALEAVDQRLSTGVK